MGGDDGGISGEVVRDSSWPKRSARRVCFGRSTSQGFTTTDQASSNMLSISQIVGLLGNKIGMLMRGRIRGLDL